MAGETALVLVGGAALSFAYLLMAGAGQPSPAWRTGFVALVVVASATALAALLRPLGRWRRDEPVARFVGERTGSGDLVLSAIELGSSLSRLEAEPAFGSP